MTYAALVKNNMTQIVQTRVNEMWEHQHEAYEFCKDKDGPLLAMDMGTGKTRPAIKLIIFWEAWLTLVVCPVAVLGVWLGEFQKHYPGEFKVLILNKGTVAKKAELMKAFIKSLRSGERGVVVTNYEAFWRDALKKVILKAKFDLVIYDECHKLKSASSNASKCAGKFHDIISKRLGLTGTPIPQNLIDIYAIYRALDNSLFGKIKYKFEAEYCIKGGFTGYQIVDYRNQKELKKKYHSNAFRVTKEECLDLPEQIFIDLTFKLTGIQQRVYMEVKRDFFAELPDGSEVSAANAAVLVTRLQQVTSGIARSDSGHDVVVGQGKANLLKELLQDKPEDQPIIIYCKFIADLKMVHDTAKSMNMEYGEISGARKDLTADSKMPSWVEVMGVQIQSGSAGIDLTRTSIAVYYSTGFSVVDYQQSLSRLHRPGQRHPVTYYNLIAEDTVDEKVFKALADKKNIIDQIVNEGGLYG